MNSSDAMPSKNPSSPQASLVLADNNLKDFGGHHFAYADTLARACQLRDIAFHAFVHKACDAGLMSALPCQPVFSRSYWEAPPDRPFAHANKWVDALYDLLDSNMEAYRDLSEALHSHARMPGTVFLPNASFRQLLAVAMVLAEPGLVPPPTFVCLMRYSLYEPRTETLGGPRLVRDDQMAGLLSIVFRELERVGTPGTIRLVTDSVLLAEEYRPLTSIPFEVLPIPHTGGIEQVVKAEVIPPKAARIRLVTLGDARAEKGFGLLAKSAAMVQRILPPGTCEFLVHGYISGPAHEAMRPVVENLKHGGQEGIQVIERSLSSEEYRALLASADAVLLPYDELTYRSRTSGPFVEALCAGKPVVVTEGTWMARELGESQAGICALDGEAEDFARAICELCLSFDRHEVAARQFGARYRAYHNPDSFLDHLLGLSKVP